MKNWQKLMARADKIAEEGRAALYRRVVLYAQVWEDEEFRTDLIADGKKPLAVLDDKVSETCANFTELYQMLKSFPDEKQWVEGNIGEMRIQMVQRVQKNGNGRKDDDEGGGEAAEEQKGKREEQMSWKDRCLKAEQRLRELVAENKELRRQIRDMNEMVKSFARGRKQKV